MLLVSFSFSFFCKNFRFFEKCVRQNLKLNNLWNGNHLYLQFVFQLFGNVRYQTNSHKNIKIIQLSLHYLNFFNRIWMNEWMNEWIFISLKRKDTFLNEKLQWEITIYDTINVIVVIIVNACSMLDLNNFKIDSIQEFKLVNSLQIFLSLFLLC